MNENLFNHIDIDPKNCHIPNGELPKEEMKAFCTSYDQAIADAGGIDLQILGIGSNGHIGFNEPGSSRFSKTRVTPLENSTRLSNAGDFDSVTQVPRLSVTMGISTILKSRKIILMAWGSSKAHAVQKSLEGPASEEMPASLLQQHEDTLFVSDEAAASALIRFKAPWLTGDCDWNGDILRKAVVNTALKIGKTYPEPDRQGL